MLKNVIIVLFCILVTACGTGDSGKKNIGPVISYSGPVTFNEGTDVTLTVEASDPDGRIVKYEWVQVVPDPRLNRIDFTLNGASISFIAPEVDKDLEVEFLVQVVDDSGAVSQVKVSFLIINLNNETDAKQLRQSRVGDLTVSSMDFFVNPESIKIRVELKAGLIEPLKSTKIEGCGSPIQISSDNIYTCLDYTLYEDKRSANVYWVTISRAQMVDESYQMRISQRASLESIAILKAKAKGLTLSEISLVKGWQGNRWIHIFNPTEHAVNLKDYALKANTLDFRVLEPRGLQLFTLPDQIIPAKSSVRLTDRQSKTSWGALDKGEGIETLIIDSNSQVLPFWDNSGSLELVTLADMNSLDSISFGEADRQMKSYHDVYVQTGSTLPNSYAKRLVKKVNNPVIQSSFNWKIAE